MTPVSFIIGIFILGWVIGGIVSAADVIWSGIERRHERPRFREWRRGKPMF